MADIKDTNFEEQLLAGSSPSATDGSKKLMVDLLHERFGADELVKIKNFTKKKTGWVYSDRKPVEQGGTFKVEQPNEFTRRVWQGEQKVRVLNPGQTVIVPGWEAYVGLVRFYKQYIGEEYSGKMGVMMNSPKDQLDFVSKAFVGVYDPNEPEEEVKDIKQEVEDDLGLVKKDEKPKAK